MKNTNKKNTEAVPNQEMSRTIIVPTEPVSLRQRIFEGAAQLQQDFEKAHPGTTRKVSCTTVIGLAATLVLDAVIILQA